MTGCIDGHRQLYALRSIFALPLSVAERKAISSVKVWMSACEMPMDDLELAAWVKVLTPLEQCEGRSASRSTSGRWRPNQQAYFRCWPSAFCPLANKRLGSDYCRSVGTDSGT